MSFFFKEIGLFGWQEIDSISLIKQVLGDGQALRQWRKESDGTSDISKNLFYTITRQRYVLSLR
jgi:hypothetical protein